MGVVTVECRAHIRQQEKGVAGSSNSEPLNVNSNVFRLSKPASFATLLLPFTAALQCSICCIGEWKLKCMNAKTYLYKPENDSSKHQTIDLLNFDAIEPIITSLMINWLNMPFVAGDM